MFIGFQNAPFGKKQSKIAIPPDLFKRGRDLKKKGGLEERGFAGKGSKTCLHSIRCYSAGLQCTAKIKRGCLHAGFLRKANPKPYILPYKEAEPASITGCELSAVLQERGCTTEGENFRIQKQRLW